MIQVHIPTILIVTPGTALADLLELHLGDEGYHVICSPQNDSVIELLQSSRPDIMMLSLTQEPREESWRLLTDVANDPETTSRVIAIVDVDGCSDHQRSLLRDLGVTVLPVVFDLDQLLMTVRSVLTPAADLPAPATAASSSESLAHVEVVEERAVEQETPAGVLARINVLIDQRRSILTRASPSIEDCEGVLRAIDQELEQLWTGQQAVKPVRQTNGGLAADGATS